MLLAFFSEPVHDFELLRAVVATGRRKQSNSSSSSSFGLEEVDPLSCVAKAI